MTPSAAGPDETPPASRGLSDLLGTVADALPDPFVVKNRAGEYVLVNAAGAAVLGVTPRAAIGRRAADFLPRETATAVDDVDRDVLDTGETRVVEHEIVVRGDPRTFLATKSPWRDPHGRVIGLVGVARDVTDRRASEASLAESLARYRALVGVMGELVWRTDSKGRVLEAEGWEAFTGVSSGLATATGWAAGVHPDDRARALETWRRAVESGEPYACVYRLRRADGNYRWCSARAVPVRDPRGRVREWIGITVDTQELRERERAARASDERLRLLVERIQGYAIYMLDADGRISTWNAGAERLTGYPAEEAIGRDFSIVYPPDPAARSPRELLEDAARLGVIEDEGWRVRRDGRRFWASASITALRDDDGTLVGFAKIIRDLTERRAAEEAIRTSEARMTGIVASAMDAIVSVDEQQRIVVFNAAAERILGCPAAEAIGSPLSRFIPERFRDIHQRHVAEFGRTGATTRHMGALGELTALRADGTEIPIEATISQVDGPGGKLFTVILRDVSERRVLEQQLRQAQKMESVGLLAGGLAHDFNNLLTAIGGSAEFLLAQLPPGHAGREDAEAIQAAVQRGAGLTRQLLAFSRRRPLEPAAVDAVTVVRELEPLLARLLGERYDVRVAARGVPGPVRIERGQLEQALVNLAVNARDAMPEGGTLRIDVADVRLDDAGAEAYPPLTAGDYVRIAVTDTGIGMDAETIRRAFEPFFTTKPPGKGTGLGLSMVYGTVRQAGGYAAIESEPGRGTTVVLLLPRADQPARPAATGARATGGAVSRGETILLVEDQLAVRNVLRRLLMRSGYRVLEAEDGIDGLRVARTYEGRIDLVLTDVTLPNLGGPAMVARLLTGRPHLRVVFMSGLADDPEVAEAMQIRGAHFLEKPFLSSVLLDTVRTALDRADSTSVA